MITEEIRSPLSAWLVESFRLSAFYPMSAPVIAVPLWQQITGELPETENRQPRIKLIQEEGQWEGAKLVVGSADSRFDLVFAPLPRPADQTAFPAVGPYLQVEKPFKRAIENWLSLGHSVQRVAIGLVLLQSVAGRVEGYKKLAEYLSGVRIDAERSRDLLYRINRPRTINDGSLNISVNRLSTWSVASLVGFSMVASERTMSASKASLVDHAIRLEIDVNTDGEYEGIIERNEVPETINHLMDYAVEIGERGDVE